MKNNNVIILSLLIISLFLFSIPSALAKWNVTWWNDTSNESYIVDSLTLENITIGKFILGDDVISLYDFYKVSENETNETNETVFENMVFEKYIEPCYTNNFSLYLEINELPYLYKIENYTNCWHDINISHIWWLNSTDLYILFDDLEPMNNTITFDGSEIVINYFEENKPLLMLLTDPSIPVKAGEWIQIKIYAKDDSQIKKVEIDYENQSYEAVLFENDIYSASIKFDKYGRQQFNVTAWDVFNNSMTMSYELQAKPAGYVTVNEYSGTISYKEDTELLIAESTEDTLFNITLNNEVENASLSVKTDKGQVSILNPLETIQVEGKSLLLIISPENITNQSISIDLSISPEPKYVVTNSRPVYNFDFGYVSRLNRYSLTFGDVRYNCVLNKERFVYVCNATFPVSDIRNNERLIPVTSRILENVVDDYEAKIAEWQDKYDRQVSLYNWLIGIDIIAIIILVLYYIFIVRGKITLR